MRIKIRKIIHAIALCLPVLSAQAQNTDSVRFAITLDSVTIRDTHSGFDISDFISLVENDTSFYAAFHNLRKVPYQTSASVRMFDNNQLTKASYTNRAEQFVEGSCRSMHFAFENTTGDFFTRNGEMRYYTAKLFSYIFYYRDTICNGGEDVPSAGSDGKLEKHKEQLKTLIFNPGNPVDGIPLIKNKLAIFSDRMVPYYNYSIATAAYKTGIECYVFSVIKKPGVSDGDVVVQQLTTWFDKKTMQIVARNYLLSAHNALFDFDVHMDVGMTNIQGLFVPGYISYDGFWNIPGKKPEHGSVQIFVSGN